LEFGVAADQAGELGGVTGFLEFDGAERAGGVASEEQFGQFAVREQPEERESRDMKGLRHRGLTS
jgi:hypothetical protein